MQQKIAAEKVGVSKQRINHLVKSGRLEANRKREVELERVLAFFEMDLEASWPSKKETVAVENRAAPGGGDEDLSDLDLDTRAEIREADVRIKRVKAEELELNLAIRKGAFLPKKDIEEAMVASGRKIRQQLEVIPEWADELYALAAKADPAELRRLLKTKTRALQQKAADALSLLAEAGDEEADAVGRA